MNSRPHFPPLLASAVLCIALPLAAQTAPTSAPTLSPADRTLAREVFAELINTNTSHSVGSTTLAAEAIAKRLRAAGFVDQDLTILGPDSVSGKRRNLLVHWRAGRLAPKPVLFICHLDVVEAPRSQWQTDPFVFTEKDGYFYGRGTQDIKDADAALVTDLVLLKRAGFQPARDLYFAFTADEEGGPDNGVDWLLKNRPELKEAAFVINPDAGTLAIQNGKPVAMEVEATEKTYADFEFKVEGPGGHSSLPTPDNVIYTLAAALLKLQASPFPVELNPVTREYFSRMAQTQPAPIAAAMRAVLQTPPDAQAAATLSQDKIANATLRTTCIATVLRAGEANNAIPAQATANINCRILPGHSPEEVRQKLVSIVADNKVSVSFVSEAGVVSATAPATQGNPPPPPLPDVFNPLARITHQFYPGLPILPYMETGASDSIYTMAAGIPSYGISGFPQDLEDIRYHARDERLRVESYYTGVEFYRLYIQALGAN
jgi:acetylornithine deacetylase/succinyl-diaminopimelate desuccinylase-like protein